MQGFSELSSRRKGWGGRIALTFLFCIPRTRWIYFTLGREELQEIIKDLQISVEVEGTFGGGAPLAGDKPPSDTGASLVLPPKPNFFYAKSYFSESPLCITFVQAHRGPIP